MLALQECGAAETYIPLAQVGPSPLNARPAVPAAVPRHERVMSWAASKCSSAETPDRTWHGWYCAPACVIASVAHRAALQ